MTEAEKLRHVAGQWLRNALGKVEEQRERGPASGARDTILAEFLLLSAQEYAETAFDAFAVDRWYPALSCARTIFEMAIKLKWCCLKEGDERRDRLFSWARETIQSQQTIHSDLADTASDEQFRAREGEAAERLQSNLDDYRELERMPNFTKIFKEVAEATDAPQSGTFVKAVMYKQLCKSTHAELDPDRYFEPVNGKTVRRDVARKPRHAYRAVLTSVFWLVVRVYEMLGWPAAQLGKEYEEA